MLDNLFRIRFEVIAGDTVCVLTTSEGTGSRQRLGDNSSVGLDRGDELWAVAKSSYTSEP
ncbi:Uncharacterised protein [Mycobacteroides abscessus subsp. abscessus]|nr:Uncharacterised protein [Mycobacteroides abscessus subsp. abscessus]